MVERLGSSRTRTFRSVQRVPIAAIEQRNDPAGNSTNDKALTRSSLDVPGALWR